LWYPERAKAHIRSFYLQLSTLILKVLRVGCRFQSGAQQSGCNDLRYAPHPEPVEGCALRCGFFAHAVPDARCRGCIGLSGALARPATTAPFSAFIFP
jgi:hypothetical protein